MNTLLAVLCALVSMLNSMPDSHRMTWQGDKIMSAISFLDMEVTEIDVTCYEDNSCIIINNLYDDFNYDDHNCNRQTAWGKLDN